MLEHNDAAMTFVSGLSNEAKHVHRTFVFAVDMISCIYVNSGRCKIISVTISHIPVFICSKGDHL